MDTDSKARLENGWLAAASQASTGDATHQDPPPTPAAPGQDTEADSGTRAQPGILSADPGPPPGLAPDTEKGAHAKQELLLEHRTKNSPPEVSHQEQVHRRKSAINWMPSKVRASASRMPARNQQAGHRQGQSTCKSQHGMGCKAKRATLSTGH